MQNIVIILIVAAIFNLISASSEQQFPKPHAIHELGQHSRRLNTKRSLEDSNLRGTELTPLFPGFGTHFAYAFVGTPPQRQSLIVDTGSHYTSFPCDSCKYCGKHTDPYWKPSDSSTAVVPKCTVKGKKGLCEFEQKYAEGSEWQAYKVQDKLWMGGIQPTLVPDAEKYSVDFEFGCQTSNKGLFKSQLADGVLGMSNGPDTLPAQLKAKKITKTSMFALCFRIGGGIMTLGGVDERIHTKRHVSYAAMVNNGRLGWYSVNLRNVYLKPSSSATPTITTNLIPINVNMTYLMGPSASAILDSGTTDTYLPSSALRPFMDAVKKVSGLDFKPKNWKLTPEQLAQLPTLIFRLQAAGAVGAAAAADAALHFDPQNLAMPTYPAGSIIDIQVPVTNYMDNVGDGLYDVRIGFTEERGAVVLGSNFMTGYNVIFDAENSQIGFAQSNCNYEEFDPNQDSAKENEPALVDPAGGKTPPTPVAGKSCTEDEMIPSTECSALCNRNETAYTATGTQLWKCVRSLDTNTPVDPKDVQERPCQESCSFYKPVRGDPECPDRPWTDCAHGCVKSRQTVPKGEKLYKNGKKKHQCNYHLQTTTCYAGSCPLQDGDYLVYVDLRVGIEPWKWSYVHSENFFNAMAAVFKLNANNMELLNDAGSEYTAGTKLHFKIRMKAKDYKDVTAMHYASEDVVVKVRSPTFGTQLVRALDDASKKTSDWPHISRYGWMYGSDVEVLSAIAMPTSGVRAPQGEEGPTYDDDGAALRLEQANMMLLGVGLAAVLLLGVVAYLYYQLRQAHALYEKDKGTLSRSGHALHRMFNTLASQAAEGIAASAGVPVKGARDREVELSSRGLMEMDEDLED